MNESKTRKIPVDWVPQRKTVRWTLQHKIFIEDQHLWKEDGTMKMGKWGVEVWCRLRNSSVYQAGSFRVKEYHVSWTPLDQEPLLPPLVLSHGIQNVAWPWVGKSCTDVRAGPYTEAKKYRLPKVKLCHLFKMLLKGFGYAIWKAIQIDIDEFTCSLNTYWKEI